MTVWGARNPRNLDAVEGILSRKKDRISVFAYKYYFCFTRYFSIYTVISRNFLYVLGQAIAFPFTPY
ncbi:MAG: hypothetical protein QNJ51_23760 [Calothrix sp. MO_167.B12]|nr:hypothetical protein [Calothrix sp. MO_167.B12]